MSKNIKTQFFRPKKNIPNICTTTNWQIQNILYHCLGWGNILVTVRKCETVHPPSAMLQFFFAPYARQPATFPMSRHENRHQVWQSVRGLQRAHETNVSQAVQCGILPENYAQRLDGNAISIFDHKHGLSKYLEAKGHQSSNKNSK